MDGGQHITREESWRMWKRLCAADLCDASTAADLRAFGTFRFLHGLQRYASRMGHRGPPLAAADAENGWHLLETYAALGATRRGKRYKDWLFDKAEGAVDWLSSVEAGASLLMRDAVRERLRQEHAPAWMTSLQSPLGVASDLSIEDLLPDSADPVSVIEEQEWREIAQAQAAAFLPELNERQRIVIWARAEGIPLNDSRLAARIGRRPGALYETYQSTVMDICGRLKKLYQDEPSSRMVLLARLVLEHLKKTIRDEFISGKLRVPFP